MSYDLSSYASLKLRTKWSFHSLEALLISLKRPKQKVSHPYKIIHELLLRLQKEDWNKILP